MSAPTPNSFGIVISRTALSSPRWSETRRRSPRCPVPRPTAAQTAPRAVADLLVNQLVHGDLMIITRGGGGGPAVRELPVTALQGGDLRDAAVRSQWTGEH